MSVEINIEDTFENKLIENDIPFLTKIIFKYFGLYNDLFNRKNHWLVKSIKYILTFIVEFYLISLMITILNSTDNLIKGFISLIIPIMLIVIFTNILFSK